MAALRVKNVQTHIKTAVIGLKPKMICAFRRQPAEKIII